MFEENVGFQTLRIKNNLFSVWSANGTVGRGQGKEKRSQSKR